MDKGLVTGVVFLDLAKAFDTVDHLILLRKLRGYGVSNNSLEWFESYISARNQVTVQCLSDPACVPAGMAKGSILGSLLFLIFVNELPDVLQHTAHCLKMASFWPVLRSSFSKTIHLWAKRIAQP